MSLLDPSERIDILWASYKQRLGLSPCLLATNSTILREASSILYGNNYFDLGFEYEPISYLSISYFLDSIGSINASQIKYLSLGFLEFSDKMRQAPLEYNLNYRTREIRDSNKKEQCLQTIKKIEEYCASLKTIIVRAFTWYFIDTFSIQKLLLAANSPFRCCPHVYEELAFVADRLKAIPSVQEIVIELICYDYSLDLYLEQKLQTYGWTVVLVGHDSGSD